MNFDMPKAVLCGLALIAAAIFFGPGSHVATASGGIQKMALCDPENGACAQVLRDRTHGGQRGIYMFTKN